MISAARHTLYAGRGCLLRPATRRMRVLMNDAVKATIMGKGWHSAHHEYEDVARRTGVFTSAEKIDAYRLRHARNVLIHDALASEIDAQEALEICAKLLDRLLPPDSPQRRIAETRFCEFN